MRTKRQQERVRSEERARESLKLNRDYKTEREKEEERERLKQIKLEDERKGQINKGRTKRE